jgi:hypothetical protein
MAAGGTQILPAAGSFQSHFGDSFRHATGTTPKKYRQCFECFQPPDKTNRKAS